MIDFPFPRILIALRREYPNVCFWVSGSGHLFADRVVLFREAWESPEAATEVLSFYFALKTNSNDFFVADFVAMENMRDTSLSNFFRTEGEVLDVIRQILDKGGAKKHPQA